MVLGAAFMTQAIPSAILEAAMALPPEARAELADILLESIEPPIDPEILKAIAAEAERRIDEVERGEITTISQEEYLASRRARWNR
jgi:putative addiction module component (TIGR02574 family)